MGIRTKAEGEAELDFAAFDLALLKQPLSDKSAICPIHFLHQTGQINNLSYTLARP